MSSLRSAVLAVVMGTALAIVWPASAASATVSAAPASWTPQITSTDARVRQLLQCGSTMYAVGSFSTVRWGGRTFNRQNAFSFDATNGAVTAWNPNVSGQVESIALSANCATAYLGGKFTQINGVSTRYLAAVSTSSGAVLTGFQHSASAMVHTLALVNQGRDLLVGGAFSNINGVARSRYASLDPTTGAVNSYLQLPVVGAQVYNQQISPSKTRLLIEGQFSTVGGQPRSQLAEIDLGATSATLDPFYSQVLNTKTCKFSWYVRTATFSPDEQTVYIATTGSHGNSYCDALTALTNTPNSTARWTNKTGNDSLYAVAASPTDVYIGGHERWANNPFGSDSCGSGCLPRPGIGDIDAKTGLATSWNPTRSRGKGADDLVITPAGLWVASDTYYNSVKCAGSYHPGICFFPGVA